MFNFVYEFLARLGYTHPIHPTEVHMPIGLVVGAFVFAWIAVLFHRPKLATTALIPQFCLLIIEIIPGFIEFVRIHTGVPFLHFHHVFRKKVGSALEKIHVNMHMGWRASA